MDHIPSAIFLFYYQDEKHAKKLSIKRLNSLITSNACTSNGRETTTPPFCAVLRGEK